MAQVLIDGSLYTFGPSGGTYHFLNELLKRLPRTPEMEFRLITVNAKTPAIQPSNSFLLTRPAVRLPFHFPNGGLKDYLRPLKQKIDLFFQKGGIQKGPSLFHSISYYPSPDPSLPMLTMVHDLIAEKFPEYYDKNFSLSHQEMKEKCIRQSRRFICVSECTKRDLNEVYGIALDRIDVVYHGFNPNLFFPATSPQNQGSKSLIASPYFLYVGGRLNHKNFERLAIAFAQSKLSKDYLLVVAGFAWEPKEIELLKKLRIFEKVQLKVSPTNEELAVLYRYSTAFVFPSLYEGFGIPLLEAMASGSPILASNTGPIPEITANAAIYFDPFDSHSIMSALVRGTDEKTRKDLVERGYVRARDFSWENTVEGTLNSYRAIFSDY